MARFARVGAGLSGAAAPKDPRSSKRGFALLLIVSPLYGVAAQGAMQALLGGSRSGEVVGKVVLEQHRVCGAELLARPPHPFGGGGVGRH